ncbi:MAG: beta-mannosidase, partial [Rhodanobacteraceae bacterium]
YVLPGEFAPRFGLVPKDELTATYVRKAAYQYGWDWGPRIVTEGIWQRVELQSRDTLRLADFHVAQQRVGAAVADLQAQLELISDHAEAVQVRLRWRAPDGTRHSLEHPATLRTGDNHVAIPFSIEHPQRWWPAGYGKPNLYHFHAEVTVGGKVMADAARTTGLRSVELRRRKDRWGKSFEFVVNGVPIFAKGANFIPMDSFPARVTPARIRQLLQSARDANMNMLRVWGGGYYLSDDFYATADRLGLMVWQEFMFGGAIPPADKAFRDNVLVEAIQQVKRLRDHPSIVLWCGNNEVEDGWEDWGDRKAFRNSLEPAQARHIEHGMRALFDRTLRKVVTKYEPSVPYWPSSPGTDYEGPVNVTGNGDYHYWNVWSGDALPATAYLDVTPRFMTEYGLQSMPAPATIDSFTQPSDRSIDSRVMRWHQKFDNGNGNTRLLKYITREYGKPVNFAATVYLSQVMQAEGIQLAAEHLRAARPESMGSLYWQLDDVWPGTTWSSIDWFGRWKMLQYHARRFYAPVRVVALRSHGTTRLDVVSDRTEAFDATLRIRVVDMHGKVLLDRTRDVHVAALASTHVADFPDGGLLHGADPRRTFAVFDLSVGGKLLSRHFLCFDHARDLQLPDPGLQATLSADGRSVTLSAKRFAREVWVTFGKLDARLSDDAFDLLPGESVTLEVTSSAGVADLRKALRVRSLYGAAMSAPRSQP